MNLSNRLAHCANFTRGFNKLADIGTDHAYLPIKAVQEGFVSKALAIDNKEGPFLAAMQNVNNHNLHQKIQVLLGNGLEKIDDDVDVVVIAGMGGSLISNILLAHSLRNVKRFILQPNNNSYRIRKTLREISYKIVNEIVFKDGNEIYEIIVVEPGVEEYSELELAFGPFNLQDNGFYFQEKLKYELKKYTEILKQVTKIDDKERIQDRINLIMEAMK